MISTCRSSQVNRIFSIGYTPEDNNVGHIKCLISPFLKLEFDLGWYGFTAISAIRADPLRHIKALIFKTINKSYEHIHNARRSSGGWLPHWSSGVSTNYFFCIKNYTYIKKMKKEGVIIVTGRIKKFIY